MIRDAEHEDVEECLELGHRMYLASQYSSLPWCSDKCRNLGHSFVEREDRYFRLYEKDNRPVGFCTGGIEDLIFSEEYMGKEYLLFTSEEVPLVGLRLMRDFEKWCINWGVMEIDFSTTSQGEDKRFEAFANRLGYRPAGRHWKRRL